MIMVGPESAVLVLCVVLPWAVIRLFAGVPFGRAVAEGLFGGYVLALLGVVFLPLRAVASGDAPSLWASVNLVPTHTIVEIVRDFPRLVIQQLVGNVVLFVPLGFFLPVLSGRCRRLAATEVVSLAVSIGIEVVQLAMLLSLLSQRSVDVDDVILNVTGAALGYLAWRCVHALTVRSAAAVGNATESA
jgi:glycopeptide antibiotics resistance protein